MKTLAFGLVAVLCVAAWSENDGLKGKITAVNPAAGTIEVSGVTIVAKNAVLENHADQRITLADLKVGDGVDVDGSFSKPGEMTATKIEQETSATDEVEGKISAVDAKGRTITVSGITVKVPASAGIENRQDMPIALDQLKQGNRVDCEGNWTGARELTALKIEID